MLARARARFSCAYTKCVNDGDYMVGGGDREGNSGWCDDVFVSIMRKIYLHTNTRNNKLITPDHIM